MINSEKLRHPFSIFLIYVIAASLFILIFKFILPGSEAPLLIYSGNWRIIQGVLEIFNFFPALIFSALVIPFGFTMFEESFKSFSDMFFKHLLASVVTAIVAFIFYGLIFFIISPLVKEHEENLRFSGELYHLAKKNAYSSRDSGDWFEASQFLNICNRIWYNSPELENLKVEVAVNLNQQISDEKDDHLNARAVILRELRGAAGMSLSGGERPVNATKALEMSREAFNDERYFDSHWLANLAVRLAADGSVEEKNAAEFASSAWNMISSLEPNKSDLRQYELFKLKLEGYEAMGTGDWIRAYYIFLELLKYTPDDPDAKNFLANCEVEAANSAFFIDEMELSVGEILNGAVFSLPNGNNRAVMRFSSLTLSADIAYGFGFDYIDFDTDMNLRSNGTARYVKIKPITFESPAEKPGGERVKKHQIVIMTHSLNRYNEDNNYQYELLAGIEPEGRIILDITFEDFLLLAKVRRGLSALQINNLFEASAKMEKAGYVKEIFQAEVLNRFGSVFFFLPMSIFVIVIAWRYRAKKKPRYFFVLMLPILPVVFHAFVFLYRSLLNNLGIWLVLSIGFTAALIIYIAMLAGTLFISLIVLSAQHNN